MLSEKQVPENVRPQKLLETLAWLEKRMEGEAERTGLDSEEKIVAFMKEVRRELIP